MIVSQISVFILFFLLNLAGMFPHIDPPHTHIHTAPPQWPRGSKRSLTVHVALVPLSPHRPIGHDLQVVSAILAVETRQLAEVPQRAAVHRLVPWHRHLLRHPARRTRTAARTVGKVSGGMSAGWVCFPPRSGQVFTSSWTSAGDQRQLVCASPTPGT